MMTDDSKRLSAAQVAEAKARRIEAMRLQEIEGNPLDADDIAMFEMFEREAWPPEKCRAHILAQIKRTVRADAAE